MNSARLRLVVIAMLFNDLLSEEHIDPSGVLVLRHTPEERELRKTLPFLADAKPDIFNAYQQTQTRAVEAKMRRAQHVASFIGREKRELEAVFVGLYKVGNHRPLTYEEFWKIPAYQEMKQRYGLRGFVEGNRPSVLWFDLTITDFYKRWQGKLVIKWPRPAILFARFADRHKFPIHAILEDSALHEAMPEWNQCVFSSAKLSILPISWHNELRKWRGIYYISDQSDGKGYVGKAAGEDNIDGRWKRHLEVGGDSVHLSERKLENFCFSILQRVSPDMIPDDVTKLEATWKDRLHTRWPEGLNDN